VSDNPHIPSWKLSGQQDREKAAKLWEEYRKSGWRPRMSKRSCDEAVAAKMKKNKRTIEHWRKNNWKWSTKSVDLANEEESDYPE